ncbi:MAG: hypothetical protein GY754_22560 [bacterium]|nr:hypothetical protein [bacterium]
MKIKISTILLISVVILSAYQLKTASANDPIDHFAVQAQALLGGYSIDSLSEVTTTTIHNDIDAFVKSKPSVSSSGLEIHCYRPTLAERASEYDQAWYKFKTPAAIDDALSIETTGSGAASEKILELAFSEARKLVPEAAALVDAQGYIFTFAKQNHLTGSTWAPATITLELRGNKEVYIKTPALVTHKIIPYLGGMNYCKVLTPSDAARILIDLAAKNFDKIPFNSPNTAPLDLASGNEYSASAINWYGVIGDHFSQEALMFVNKDYEQSGNFKGTCMISPGGFIPAISMRGLAKEIASRGYVVFIIKYPTDLAFWESMDHREGSAVNLATLIKDKQLDEINGLSSAAADFYSAGSSPMIVLGHSLGGAALGSLIFDDPYPFDNIILYGVTSFIKMPWQNSPAADSVDLFIGINELKTSKKINKVLTELSINLEADADGIHRSSGSNRTFEFIPELSHFCIISDMQVGSSSKREKDGLGPAPSESVEIFVDHLAGRGLLE